MLLVIGFHNLPEGFLIGAAGSHDLTFGITLAIIIGLHNIPEGMAIAAPLISGGVGKRKAIWMTLLAEVPTVLGALAGVLIGNISSVSLALSFAVAGGAMLYVVFGEILPQVFNLSGKRIPALTCLAGIIVGLLLTVVAM